MASKKVYSAGLVSKLLWFNELKKTALLKDEFTSIEKLKENILSENIYQINNIERNKRILSYCVKRIDLTDDTLLDILKYGQQSDAKLVALILTMKCEKILFDFVYEVYREKIILGDYEISEKDMKSFFDYKITQSEEIAGWSEQTIEKMSQTILKMLSECGLIIKKNRKRIIEQPLLGNRLETYLKDNMNVYYKAIIGGN